MSVSGSFGFSQSSQPQNNKTIIPKYSRVILGSVPAIASSLDPAGCQFFLDHFLFFIPVVFVLARPWNWKSLLAGGILINLFYGIAKLIVAGPTTDFQYVATFVLLTPLTIASIVLGLLEIGRFFGPKSILNGLALGMMALLLTAVLPTSLLEKWQVPFEMPALILGVLTVVHEALPAKLRRFALILCLLATVGHLKESVRVLESGSLAIPAETLLISVISALGYCVIGAASRKRF